MRKLQELASSFLFFFLWNSREPKMIGEESTVVKHGCVEFANFGVAFSWGM